MKGVIQAMTTYSSNLNPIQCDTCKRLVWEWYADGADRSICKDCWDFQDVLKRARTLMQTDQQRLIQQLNRDRFEKAKR